MKTMVVCVVVLSLAIMGATVVAGAPAESGSAADIYALIAANQLPEAATLRSPYIVGISVRASWADMEPIEGRYRWGYFDRCIAQARRAGLLVMLQVVPDYRTPQWVYGAGAQRFEYIDTNPYHATYGQLLAIPVPWDAVFLDKWTRFVSAFGKHYNSNPAVSTIHCTSSNWSGGEMHLPKTPEDIQRWYQIGYTPEILLEAWQRVIDAYALSFPDHPFAVSVARAIDSDQMTADLVNYGVAEYGPRFQVQGNWLSAFTNEEWYYYRLVRDSSLRTQVGFQMLASATHYPGRQGDLGTALDKGLRAGASYFEVYEPDVLNQEFADELRMTRTLSVTGDGAGSVLVNAVPRSLPWSGEFAYGSSAELVAVPDSGSQFAGWLGDVDWSTSALGLTTEDSVTVVMDEDHLVRAHFLALDPAFVDVPPDHWAFAALSACRAAGIAGGYPDGTYRPSDPVDRGQMAVYISRALAGSDAEVPSGPASPTFSDVPANHWAFRYVEYAHANNVVEGYPEGVYRPAALVTRDQMAAFVARSIVTPTGDDGLDDYIPPGTPSFVDVAPDHWAYKYIEHIAQPSVAVIQGYDDSTYRPVNTVTRDQMAVYTVRAFVR